MVTLGSIAIDGAAEKKAPVHPNWFVLYAADDITDVRPILDGAMILLCSKKGDRFMVEAGDALATSFAKRHEDLMKFRVLLPRGFKDLNDFHSRKNTLPISEISEIKRQLRATKPACEFLMAGFDPMGVGHLLLQEPNSPFQCYDDPGFWAIGSGQHEALAALFSRPTSSVFRLRALPLNACITFFPLSSWPNLIGLLAVAHLSQCMDSTPRLAICLIRTLRLFALPGRSRRFQNCRRELFAKFRVCFEAGHRATGASAASVARVV